MPEPFYIILLIAFSVITYVVIDNRNPWAYAHGIRARNNKLKRERKKFEEESEEIETEVIKIQKMMVEALDEELENLSTGKDGNSEEGAGI